MVKEKNESFDDDFDDDDDESVSENQFLTFKVDSENYGINIMQVVEIIRMIKITEVPHTYQFIKGIINLRGKIIPVMDIRIRFGIPEKDYDERTCIIVTNMKDVDMGIIVDRVSEVVEVLESQIDPMPKINNKNAQKYVKGIGKVGDEIKILLDLDRLLFNEELETIKQIQS